MADPDWDVQLDDSVPDDPTVWIQLLDRLAGWVDAEGFCSCDSGVVIPAPVRAKAEEMWREMSAEVSHG